MIEEGMNIKGAITLLLAKVATLIEQAAAAKIQNKFAVTQVDGLRLSSVEGCEAAAEGGFLKRRLFSIRVSLCL